MAAAFGLPSLHATPQLENAGEPSAVSGGLPGEAAASGVADKPAAASSTSLERKWTSVLRLQKRITDLEAQVSTLKAEAAAAAKAARGIDEGGY